MKKITTIIAVLLFVLGFVVQSTAQSLSPEQIKALDKQACEQAEQALKSGTIEYKSVFKSSGTSSNTIPEPEVKDLAPKAESKPTALKKSDQSLFKQGKPSASTSKQSQKADIAPEIPKDTKLDPQAGKAHPTPVAKVEASEVQPVGKKSSTTTNYRNIKGSDQQEVNTKSE